MNCFVEPYAFVFIFGLFGIHTKFAQRAINFHVEFIQK